MQSLNGWRRYTFQTAGLPVFHDRAITFTSEFELST